MCFLCVRVGAAPSCHASCHMYVFVYLSIVSMGSKGCMYLFGVCDMIHKFMSLFGGGELVLGLRLRAMP